MMLVVKVKSMVDMKRTRNYRPGDSISLFLKILILVVMMELARASMTILVNGYAGGTLHNSFYASCRACHQAMSGYPSEATRIFENYRCIACHTDENFNEVYAVVSSAHGLFGCTYCHDVLHEGHNSYSTSTRGLYGCWRSMGGGGAGGCHMVVSQDYYAPSYVDVSFGIVYRGVETGIRSTPLWKRVFSPTASNVGRGIYTLAFMDPSTGSYDDIPRANSYWMCLKCHFIRKLPDKIGQTSSYWTTHDDKCYGCHSKRNVGEAPHSIPKTDIWLHAYAWKACKNCHTGVAAAVENSVHHGCRCHSVIHISRYNGSASWVFMYYSSASRDYVSPECLDCHIMSRSMDVDRYTYYYTEDNWTALNVVIYPLLDTQTNSIKYFGIYYLLRTGDASIITGPESAYATCFNCHFIASGVGGASSLELNGLIPIPESSIKGVSDPHTIQLSTSGSINTNGRSSATGSGKGFIIAFIVAASALLLIITGLIRRASGDYYNITNIT